MSDKRVKSFGEPSRGTWSPTLVKSLANGWIFTVPNYQVVDAEKNHLEGTKITPSITSQHKFIDSINNSDIQLEEILTMLAR